MNYSRIYDELIARGVARGRPQGYSEQHHILPRSLGGGNEPFNLVRLTAREHFIAHYLLAKTHGGSQWHSFVLMSGRCARAGSKINARLFEKGRLSHSQALSEFYTSAQNKERHALRTSEALKARHAADPTLRERISKGVQQAYSDPNLRKRVSNSMKTHVKTAEHLAAISQALRGRKLSPEAREKMRIAKLGKKISPAHAAALHAGRKQGALERRSQLQQVK